MTPDGGELLELPMQPANMNSIRRIARLTLDAAGTLKGEVQEVRIGDHARLEREVFLSTAKDTDQIKPIERLLGEPLTTYRITSANAINLHHNEQPLGFNYSFVAEITRRLRVICC
jgi:hypothetical protein